jgi:hypothetical protein
MIRTGPVFWATQTKEKASFRCAEKIM